VAGGAEITAETMGGNVDIAGSPAYLRVRTAGGRISWSGESDNVSLTTVTGAIDLPATTLLRARIESIAGNVTWGGGVKPDGRVEIDSHAGNITLALSSGARANLTLDAPKSSVAGRSFARAPGKSAPLATVRDGAEPGKRSAEVLARTFKGTVTVTTP
jgi:hypothetical protein